MKLWHFRGPNGERNFGDELGPWLWNRLIPDALDDDGSTLFVGIGTLLNNRLPRADRLVVFGAGVGYGDAAPEVDRSWSIYCVRGPLSARVLKIPPDLGLTDPGALVRRFVPAATAADCTGRFAYMPHWRSACDEWQRVCDAIGFTYIDPRRDVDDVIGQIKGARTLVAEALHGAIVADALRVPWIAARSTADILDFKWRDWCASLELSYHPHRIVPVFPLWQNPTVLRRAKYSARLAGAAARLLSLRLYATPMLSAEPLLSRRVDALSDALERIRHDYGHTAHRTDALRDAAATPRV